jgi:hypothetical protein
LFGEVNILFLSGTTYISEEVLLMARVGVEQSLTNVSAALREKGYEVVDLRQEADAQGCDCCVVSGVDSNVMGMQDAAIQGSVIEASGLSADEVCRQVEQKFGQNQ